MSKFEKIDETHFRKIPENRDIPLEVGDFVEVDLNATEEEIANAKRAVVDRLFEQIREIADKNDDFFIIKEGLLGDCKTVAAKIVLPTVKS